MSDCEDKALYVKRNYTIRTEISCMQLLQMLWVYSMHRGLCVGVGHTEM